jgi:hypothetical protein
MIAKILIQFPQITYEYEADERIARLMMLQPGGPARNQGRERARYNRRGLLAASPKVKGDMFVPAGTQSAPLLEPSTTYLAPGEPETPT